MSRLHQILVAASIAAVVAAPLAAQSQATQAGQTAGDPDAAAVVHACYTPITGVVYRIKEAGLPQACFALGNYKHVEFSWNQVGPQGPAGARGATGDKGDNGAAGERGADGAQGAQGPVGPAGPAGEGGAAGAQGPAGPTGVQGDKGDKGDKGDVGPAGPQGPMGPQGPPAPVTGYSNRELPQGQTLIEPLGTGSVFVPCSHGKIVIGGGALTGGAGRLQSSYPSSRPFPDGDREGWAAYAYNGDVIGALTLQVVAICVTP
jgi:collagen triple helix repeat protein